MPADGEDEARAFYAGILKFTELPKPTNLVSRGGVWSQIGDLALHLGIEKPFTPARKAHVAYQVSDLEEMTTLLQVAGYPIHTDEPLPGYDRLYTEDPLGNRVELLTPNQRHS